MTKKELIEKLAPYPDNMDVFIEKTLDDFQYSLVSDISVKEVKYSDNGIEPIAYDECIIISDEYYQQLNP